MSGTFLAQLIPLIVAPILTRLYTPVDFGVYGTLSALIALLTIFSTGKYELALNIPSNLKEVKSLIILSLILSVITCVFISALSLFFDLNQILNLDNTTPNGFILLVICLSVLVNGINLCFRYLSNRTRYFSIVARSQILNSLASGASKISLGYMGLTALSLNTGDIVGAFIGLASYFRKYKNKVFRIFIGFDIKSIKSVAYKYRDFPIYQTLNSGVVRMISYAPILIFSQYYGVAIVGFYELSIRILNRPLVVFTTAVTDVYREEVVKEIKQYGSAKHIFLKTFKGLLLLSILPFVILFLFAHDLFTLIFGEEWLFSGSITIALIPLYWSRFIVSPLTYVFIVVNKQKEAAVWNTTISLISVAILFTGSYLQLDVTKTLLIFSLIYLIYYILLFLRSYKIA